MRLFASPIGIWSAVLVGIAATAVFGQSFVVFTGTAAYGDWHSDAPGVRRKITPADMPPPYATASANNGPSVVAGPPGAWPKAPPGFVVELVASGLDNPRLIRVSPSGDLFVAESRPGRVRVVRSAQGGENRHDQAALPAARRRAAAGLTRAQPWTNRKSHSLSGYSGATTVRHT